MRAISAVAFALTLVGSWAAVIAQTRAPSLPAYRVIVNPGNPTTSIERRFLVDVFFKKATRWSHGEVIRPVDQGPDSSVRQMFSEEVLRRPAAAMKSYWQQQLFSGRDLPPPEVDSDEDVVKYVLKYTGAVGYVSGSANLNGAKVVAVK